VLAGRTTSAGSATTILASTSRGSTLVCRATIGNGLLADSTSTSRYGVWGRSITGTLGTGGAVRGEGRANIGVRGDTASQHRWGVHAVNAAPVEGTGAAILAEGRRNPGLVVSTGLGVNTVPAVVAVGGSGGSTGFAIFADGAVAVNGDLAGIRSFVGVVASSGVELAAVASGAAAYHTVTGKATLDGTGAATVNLAATFTTAVDMTSARISLTAIGGAMPGLFASYTEAAGTTSFTISGGAAAGTVHYSLTATRKAAAPAATGVAAAPAKPSSPSGLAFRTYLNAAR
jgi:hypothetical protein